MVLYAPPPLGSQAHHTNGSSLFLTYKVKDVRRINKVPQALEKLIFSTEP
jgi:hypothetical protein